MKEKSTLIDKNQLLKLALEQGFHAATLLTPDSLYRALDSITEDRLQAKRDIHERLTNYFNIDFFAPTASFSFLVCGLSYVSIGDGAGVPMVSEIATPISNLSPKPSNFSLNGSWGAIAPFAWKNYYREAVIRLKVIVRRIGEQTGFDKTRLRIFCNSGAPEKFLACASGLGGYGKNSLIINPELGSNFIIAGILLPFLINDDSESCIPEKPGALCGNCRACMDSCPVQAIHASGEIDTSCCIQALATELIVIPDSIKKAFGNRIYGCQVCQEVCPDNTNRQAIGTTAAPGEIGSRISLKKILESKPLQLKAFLKGTVPGSSWIDTRSIQRNALLAAGNLKSEECLQLVTTFLDFPHPALADAASWADKMIRSR